MPIFQRQCSIRLRWPTCPRFLSLVRYIGMSTRDRDTKGANRSLGSDALVTLAFGSFRSLSLFLSCFLQINLRIPLSAKWITHNLQLHESFIYDSMDPLICTRNANLTFSFPCRLPYRLQRYSLAILNCLTFSMILPILSCYFPLLTISNTPVNKLFLPNREKNASSPYSLHSLWYQKFRKRVLFVVKTNSKRVKTNANQS